MSEVNQVFVGNLPFVATPEEIKDVFRDFGYEVRNVRLLSDRETQQPRGCGFVTLARSAPLNQIIRTMAEATLHDRRLRISQVHNSKPITKRVVPKERFPQDTEFDWG